MDILAKYKEKKRLKEEEQSHILTLIDNIKAGKEDPSTFLFKESKTGNNIYQYMIEDSHIDTGSLSTYLGRLAVDNPVFTHLNNRGETIIDTLLAKRHKDIYHISNVTAIIALEGTVTNLHKYNFPLMTVALSVDIKAKHLVASNFNIQTKNSKGESLLDFFTEKYYEIDMIGLSEPDIVIDDLYAIGVRYQKTIPKHNILEDRTNTLMRYLEYGMDPLMQLEDVKPKRVAINKRKSRMNLGEFALQSNKRDLFVQLFDKYGSDMITPNFPSQLKGMLLDDMIEYILNKSELERKEITKHLVQISITLQHIAIIHYLINKDMIDINNDIFNKKRILQHALSSCDIQYIRSLISLGADPRYKWGQNKNRNYIDYANKSSNIKVKANVLVNLIKDKIHNLTNKDERSKQKDAEEKPSRFRSDGIDYKNLNIVIKVAGYLVIVILVFVAFTYFSKLIAPIGSFIGILTPFIIGLVFAWLLLPFVNELEKRNLSRGSAAGLVSLLTFLVILILFAGVIFITIYSLFINVTGDALIGIDTSTLLSSFNNGLQGDSFVSKLVVMAGEGLGFIENGVVNTEFFTGIIGPIGSTLYTFLISIIVAAYSMPLFHDFSFNIKSLIPRKFKHEGSQLIDITGTSFAKYMRGQLFIASMVGLAVTVMITLVSLVATIGNYDVILNMGQTGVLLVLITITIFGIIAMVTNLVPYIGPVIGAIPITLIVLLNDGSPIYIITILTLLSFVIVQSLESLFLQPTIMGKEMKLHPVMILLGITVFGAIFGVVGMIISTPLLRMIKEVMNYYDKKYGIF